MVRLFSVPAVAVLCLNQGLTAQERAIEFPDVPGYQTLAVDLHTHSVFSDGLVWPIIRVEESERDGLDLMAVTEHLEYQPRREDIPHPDRNRSFVVATEHARSRNSDLIIVNGAEITRQLPPGHVNAVFLADANPLLADDAMDAFREANRQGAFVFWNHPWSNQPSAGVAALTDMHRTLIADGLLHGIEVANGQSYSAEALQIALDHDLVILGVSDIHSLIDWDYSIHAGGHRTVTLVLAEERTAASVREALRARRTIAWINNSLIGREDVVVPLIRASLRVANADYRDDTDMIDVTLSNNSDTTFELEGTSGHRFHEHTSVIRVPAHGEIVLGVTGEDRTTFALEFEVLNALSAPDTHPSLEFPVDLTAR